MVTTGSETASGFASASCRARAVLDRIGDKWAIYVVDRLGPGPRRFSELLRAIDGITARMLTVTLRGLERDGILTRTVHASVPPRVDYALTPLGETLREAIGQLIAWADDHLPDVQAAQISYDGRNADDSGSEEPCSAEEQPCPQAAAG